MGSLVVENDKWKVAGTDIDYDIAIISPPLFTGIADVDKQILLKLDDNSLASVCQINKYTASLCKDQHFWLLKIQTLYPDFPNINHMMNMAFYKLLSGSNKDFVDVVYLAVQSRLSQVVTWAEKYPIVKRGMVSAYSTVTGQPGTVIDVSKMDRNGLGGRMIKRISVLSNKKSGGTIPIVSDNFDSYVDAIAFIFGYQGIDKYFAEIQEVKKKYFAEIQEVKKKFGQ